MFIGKDMPFVTLKLSPMSLIPSSIANTAAAGLPGLLLSRRSVVFCSQSIERPRNGFLFHPLKLRLPIFHRTTYLSCYLDICLFSVILPFMFTYSTSYGKLQDTGHPYQVVNLTYMLMALLHACGFACTWNCASECKSLKYLSHAVSFLGYVLLLEQSLCSDLVSRTQMNFYSFIFTLSY